MKEPSKRKLKTRENLNKLSILISMYKRRRRNYDTLLDFIDKERKNKKHPPKPSAAPKDIAITEEKLEDHVLSRHRREIENITSEIIELLRLANQPQN